MRAVFCIVWAALMFLFLCVWDVGGAEGTRFEMRIADDPSWSGFFGTFDLFNGRMILRKLGHIFAFFVL